MKVVQQAIGDVTEVPEIFTGWGRGLGETRKVH